MSTPHSSAQDHPDEARVVVVASVRLYREALATTLRGRPNIVVVGSCPPSADLPAEAAAAGANVCLVDVRVPGLLPLVRRLTRADPPLPVVGFAVSEGVERLADYAEAGMSSFVPADARFDDLCEALFRVLRGEAACSPQMAGALIRRVHRLASHREGVPEVETLTDREQEIVALIDQGMSNKAIAARLGIRVPTVKNHVHNLLGKLGVSGRSEAAARVRRVRRGRSRV